MSEKTIYVSLIGAGLTSEGAAGLMGNMKAESSMKANIAQRGMTNLSDESYTMAADLGQIDFIHDSVGYGLCQWTYYSRKAGLIGYAKECGVSVGDEDMQVNYCLKELQDYPGVLSVLMTSHDLKRCSDIVCTEFERPAVNNLDVRYEFAKQYYERFSSGFAVDPYENSVPDHLPPFNSSEGMNQKNSIGSLLSGFFGHENSSGKIKMKNAKMPVLKEGDTGAGVAAVQVALKYHKINLGDSGTLGVFESGTTMGIKDFQKQNGLEVTGEVGPETWGRLML
jgi:hypothetical protein